MEVIHVKWDGLYSYTNDLDKLKDNEIDYGIYQIYGTHPVYGSNQLLYIGKADQQTFGLRLAQEDWFWNSDGRGIKVYVGRIARKYDGDSESWSSKITKVEKLLIYSHSPAYNSSNILSLGYERELFNVHILNWECFNDLLPEVSGARWTSKHDDDEYEIYRYKD